jgi:hypothetical protein
MAEGEGTLYCRRCDDDVRAIRPWRGWKPAWAIWKVGFVGALALFPLLASDYCVMLPSMMLYIAAAGPLRSFARQPPVCGRCSLELEEGANARPAARSQPAR